MDKMKRVSASYAKNHFGELLEDVTALGGVEIVKHGRVVAIILSPRARAEPDVSQRREGEQSWTRTHMIPPALARTARLVSAPARFDDEWA